MKREKRMIVIVENGAVAGSATCELSSRCKCKVSLKKPTFAMAVFSCQKTESVRVVDGVKEFVHEFDCESISDLAVYIVSQGSVACGAVNRRISGYEIAEVVKKYAFVKDEKKNTAERELSQEGDGGKCENKGSDGQAYYSCEEGKSACAEKIPVEEKTTESPVDESFAKRRYEDKKQEEETIACESEDTRCKYEDEAISEVDFYPSNIVCITDENGEKTISLAPFDGDGESEELTEIIHTLAPKRENKTESSAKGEHEKLRDDALKESAESAAAVNIGQKTADAPKPKKEDNEHLTASVLHRTEEDSVVENEGKKEDEIPAKKVGALSSFSSAEGKQKSRINGEPSGRKAEFYEGVRDKIDGLFSSFSRQENLQSAMPDTEWVRVEYGGGKHYVVGIVGGREEPEFICYGIPARYSPQPPVELEGKAKWLPIDVKAPHEEGYWLVFQSAKTGETLSVYD